MTDFPQTPAATAALTVATRFYPPALLNHCVRSYLWGRAYAAAHDVAVDDELFYVAAMRDDVSAAVDPESHLQQVATSWDVAGRRPEEFPAAARAEVVARYPRLGFAQEFLGCFQDQATRKPDGAAAASMASDGARRIASNPLDG